jgi:hypothetical protein
LGVVDEFCCFVNKNSDGAMARACVEFPDLKRELADRIEDAIEAQERGGLFETFVRSDPHSKGRRTRDHWADELARRGCDGIGNYW